MGAPRREAGEPELHYRYRWVDTTEAEDGEPATLIPLRQMIYESPAKFYTLYAEQQRRWDEIKKEQVVKEAAAEVPLDACHVLVSQMIDEWERRQR
jgi:hypothetical protein